MDKQQMFETSLMKVREQGTLATHGLGACVFQMFDGDKELRCAVGWLLDEKKLEERGYSMRDDGGGIDELVERFGMEFVIGADDPALLEFLQALQNAHDNSMLDENGGYIGSSGAMERFETNMRIVAEKWGLTFPNA